MIASVHVFSIPDAMRTRVLGMGPLGEQWLAALPDTLADLARQWSFVLGEPLAGGNAANLVARVRLNDGGDAVLKVCVPDSAVVDEIHTIAAAHGRGYVRLLAHDLSRYAMLQESLGPSMYDTTPSPERSIDLLCETLHQAWQVPRPASALVLDRAGQLSALIAALWPALGRPCSTAVVERAHTYASRRTDARDSTELVVCHGDPHPGNALAVMTSRAGAESGYVFVDPDGLVVDRAYDLGVVLRGWCAELLAAKDAAVTADGYCQRIAAATGVDAEAVWQWGYIQRVSTGLWLLSLGIDWGRLFLDSAERIVKG